jgi:hypothetical protein
MNREETQCQGNYDIGFNEIKLLGFFHHLWLIKRSRSRFDGWFGTSVVHLNSLNPDLDTDPGL